MNKIEKRHAHRKRVRIENARLRRRGPKKHSRYNKLVTYKIELSPETLAKVILESKRTGLSKEKVIRKALNKFMEDFEDGIQKEPNIKMDEDTK